MRVKRLSVTICAVFVALLILSLAIGADRVANKILFYIRVARLYTEEPDQRLAMPLLEVRKVQISDTWKAPRGVDRLHEGQDIFAPRGTPIYSATSGYVYSVREDNLGGHTVSVIGAGGRLYYYAHLDSYALGLAEGDRVTRETILGYVGTSGNAVGTPPHLHFGVYTSSGAINPLPLLSDRLPTPAATNRSTNSTGLQPQKRIRR